MSFRLGYLFQQAKYAGSFLQLEKPSHHAVYRLSDASTMVVGDLLKELGMFCCKGRLHEMEIGESTKISVILGGISWSENKSSPCLELKILAFFRVIIYIYTQ